MFMFSTVFQIAATTRKETMRQSLYWVLSFSALLLFVLLQFMTLFVFSEAPKQYTDSGLATILITGLFLAVFSASSTVDDEIEQRTAITLLSKPVSRWHFIVGKFVGISVALFISMFTLGLIFSVMSYFFDITDIHFGNISEAIEHMGTEEGEKLKEAYNVRFEPSILVGVYSSFLQVMVLTAISILISVKFRLMTNLLLCFTIFLLGNIISQALGTSSQGVSFLSLMPLFGQINLNDTVAVRPREVIDFSLLLNISIYSISLCSFYLILATMAFRRREIL